MEIIKRKTEVTKESMDTGWDQWSLQFSYNSDGHFVLRVKYDPVESEDTIIVLTKTETNNLFKFVKQIKEIEP